MNLDSFGTKIDGSYGFGYNGNYTGTGSDFSIDVGNIPAKVCEHIKNAEYKMLYKTLINDAENGDCSSEDDNAIEFVFNDNLGTGNSGGGGNSDGVCASGIVKVYDCNTKMTTDCCPDKETCEQPTCSCSADGDCPGEQVCEGAQCKCPYSDSDV